MVLYAKDIVEKEFLSMPPTTLVSEAAKAMATHHQGFAIVAPTEGAPMGIVTEWDVLAKVVAEGRDPSQVHLADIMSTALVSVDPNEGIDRVAQLMAAEGTRRVLVVKDSKVLGVIRVKTILARLRDYIDAVSAQIARAQMPLF
ncbi:MAG TPA: CBS domain-containing protein [Thermoplasmata archaeon]|nr:CBS domain-containing protein [Thermoplasmata archaeon]